MGTGIHLRLTLVPLERMLLPLEYPQTLGLPPR
jgi:hypothetical protein